MLSMGMRLVSFVMHTRMRTRILVMNVCRKLVDLMDDPSQRSVQMLNFPNANMTSFRHLQNAHYMILCLMKLNSFQLSEGEETDQV